MTIIEGLLIFITILLVYFIIVKILHKKGILEKYNISLYGIALLLRTDRGKNFLKKIARRKRFWKSFGSFAIVFCFIAMILLVIILIWQAWMTFGLDLTPAQKASLPGPEVALILPGINPILPLGHLAYIIIALIIAMVVHEFSHGILTFVGDLKVKSLGLLYLIIPIGAFTEPDEEELKKAETGKRMRVYSAGPLSNFTVAFITLLLFSFVFISAVQPTEGVHIFYIVEDSPAEEIGLSSGMVITNLNDTDITSYPDFSSAIENTSAYQTINISYSKQGEEFPLTVTLANKYDFTQNESHINISYLGVAFNPYVGYINALKNPFTYYFPEGFLLLYSVPFFYYLTGFSPMAEPFTDSYEITGPLGALPADVFWAIVTALYWIFWLNFAVGLFNVLPIIPLDGGFLFNDAIRSFIRRARSDINQDQQDKYVKNISIVVSLVVLFLVIFPFFIKYL